MTVAGNFSSPSRSSDSGNRTVGTYSYGNPHLIDIMSAVDEVTKWTALVCTSFGLVVNLMVILVSLKFSKLPTHRLLILHLAIADLIYLFFYSFWVDRRFRKHHWIFGDFLCKCTVLWISALSCSMFTITFIAVERYRTLMNPFVPKLTRKASLFCLMMLWLISIGLQVPHFLHKKTTDRYGRVDCATIWPKDMHGSVKYLNLAVFVLTYPLPMMILLFCYARIGIKVYLRRRAEAEDPEHASIHRAVSVNHKRQKNHKLLIRLLGVLAVFLVTTTPNQAMILWMGFAPKQQSIDSLRRSFIVLHCLSALVHFHPCLNPLIYCISDPRYRSKFKEILTGIKRALIARIGVVKCCRSCAEGPKEDEGKTSLSLLVRQKTEEQF